MYGTAHDQVLKMSLRGGRKSSSELLELPALADAISELSELMEEDSGKAKHADDDEDAKDKDKDGEGAGTTAADSSIDENLDKLNADDKVRVDKFKTTAEESVTRHVKLVAEPASSTALANILKSSSLGVSGGGKKIVIVYDAKLAGEAATHPHIRKPPFRAAHYKKLVLGVMESRPGGATAIHPDDIFVLFDGGKHGWGLDLATPRTHKTE